VFLACGVVGLDFDAWGLYLVVVKRVEINLSRCLVYMSTDLDACLGR
jgi:hypothetical protein